MPDEQLETQKLLSRSWPKNLKEAIAVSEVEMTDNDKKHLAERTFTQKPSVEPGNICQYVRNHYGLWRGNKELLMNVDANNPEPDNVSSVITDSLVASLKAK